VTLEPAALAQLIKIIDGIARGKPAPRVSGHVGHFLRTLESTRFDVQQLLARESVCLRADGWASGNDLGTVELTLLAELRGSVPTDRWGPVEHAPALSEELGAVLDLTLWTSARSANRAHVLAADGKGAALELTGGYRWFPPGRLTPGDARVDDTGKEATRWRHARFLKATADDIGRAPHPLEYILDYRVGPPALKAFRVFAARRRSDAGFEVISGLVTPARRVDLQMASPLAEPNVGACTLVFAYREPWDAVWHAIDVAAITPAECLAHALSWADFETELTGSGRLTATDGKAIRDGLVAVGLDPPPVSHVFDMGDFERHLLPAARALTRWLRYRR
jgi:hypothetical protein